MASKRRGGFRPPELRGTLGTLIRTTTGVVRDAIERGAREGRARLDDVRSRGRRHDALADLGEIVLDLIRRGEIDLAELPEARELIRELDELDEPTDEPDRALPRTTARRRFDDRPTRVDDRLRRPDDHPRVDERVRQADDRPRRPSDAPRSSDDRPRRPSDAPRSSDDRPRRPTPADADDDGTVSSGVTDRLRRPSDPPYSSDDRPRRPTPAADDDDGGIPPAAAERSTKPTSPERPASRVSSTTRAPTKPIKGVWRPPIDDDPPMPERPDRPERPTIPRNPDRKGGISFDDEDLAEYMHPDDVPAKTAPKDPDDHGA